MAYSKLFKVTSDFAVGYGLVNQLRDNLDATEAAAIVAHGSSDALSMGRFRPVPPPRPLQFGHHSDARIPRASVAVRSTSFPGGLTIMDLQTTDPHIASFVGMGAGVLKLEVRDLSTFWAHGVARSDDATAVRFVQARTYLGGAGQPPCLIVTSYELNAGDMVPTNYDFDLHVYGTP